MIYFIRSIGPDVLGEFEFEVGAGGFRAAEGQGGAAEFGDGGVAVGQKRERLGRDRLTHGDFHAGSHAAHGFAEEEGDAQRVIGVAQDLEGAGILAVEINRHDGDAGQPCQLADEGMPGIFHRGATERVLAGGHAAAGKHHEGMAEIQPIHGAPPGGHGCRLGFFGAAEIDGQQIAAGFRRLAQQAVGHDQRIGAGACGEVAHGEAIDHAEGMVGHEEHGAAARDFCECCPVHVEAQVQQPKAGGENVFMGMGIFGPGALEPLQPGLAGEPLDQTDDEALQGAMFLPRITEMDGRGGLFVEVAGGVEGFKHQIM